MAAKKAKAGGKIIKALAITAAVLLSAGAIGIDAYLNAQAMAAKGPIYLAFGIALAIASAICVEVFVHGPSLRVQVLAGLVGVIVLYAAFTNLQGNFTAVNAAQADTLSSEVETHGRLKREVEQAQAKYDGIVGTNEKPGIGFDPVSTFETALRTAQNADEWRDKACPPRGARFHEKCTNVRAAVDRAEAARDRAKERDTAKTELETAKTKLEQAPNPQAQSERPAAGNESALAAAGLSIAAGVPAILHGLLIALGIVGASSPRIPASEEAKPKRIAPETAVVPAGPMEKVEALIDEHFEVRPGAKLFVKDKLRPFVLNETGHKLNDNDLKLIKKLMEARGYKHESPKGGRSYYMDVGIKAPPLSHRAKGPHLAVDNTLASVG